MIVRQSDVGVSLTSVECVVLHALARGCHSKEIASDLGKSKPTIEGYIRVLYAKLNARSRAHLVAEAFRIGALRLDR